MTYYERIQKMSIEEFAAWLCGNTFCFNCPGEEKCKSGEGSSNGLAKWLQQEVEE